MLDAEGFGERQTATSTSSTVVLETLARSLAAALDLPPTDVEAWAAMADLKQKLEPIVHQTKTVEPIVTTHEFVCNDMEGALPGLDDDMFTGVPDFSVGSPGPPPEVPPEADLIGDAGRSTSIDDLLGGLGDLATFDLLAPSPLLPGSTASRASPFVATAEASTASSCAAASAPLVQPDPAETQDSPTELLKEEDVETWTAKHGNLRALLSTLHEVLPRGWAAASANWGWEPLALSAIIDGTAALEAYRRAAVVVHPDKLRARGRSPQEQARGQAIFTALKRAQVDFKRNAM
jgi:hypothetical protein